MSAALYLTGDSRRDVSAALVVAESYDGSLA